MCIFKIKGIEDRSYALKCIQKQRVVQYKQQRHILDEKNILMSLESPFIVGLYRTFKGKRLSFFEQRYLSFFRSKVRLPSP